MKKLLTLIPLMCIMACKQNAGTTNQKLVEEYFQRFNKHQWKELAEMYTLTARFKDPSLGQEIVDQSRKQIENKYAELNQIFPDLHDRVLKIYPSGDKHVVVEFISTGTAPDQSKFKLPICTIFTIENGLISQDFTYYDNFDEK